MRVLAYFDGWKEHSGVTWNRPGVEFMVRHSEDTVADGWARGWYEEALKRINADGATITHWMPLPEFPK